jgi:hypothetical protein
MADTACAGRGSAVVDLPVSSANSSLRRAALPTADAADEFSGPASSAAAAGATASPGTGWPLAGWVAWTGMDIPTDGQARAPSAGVTGDISRRAGPPCATSTRAPPGAVPLARTGTAGPAVADSADVPVTCAVVAGIRAAVVAPVAASAVLAGAEAGGAVSE